jgi:hypothetical protein
MRKLNLFFGFILFSVLIISCTKKEEDREKEVVFTIYEETGYSGALLSKYLTEPFLFSDSDDEEIHTLTDKLVEGLLDFDYERGYRYTFKAKKIWMSEPPQDASNIKYVISELLSKEKVITTDKEKEITLFVASETVKFIPRYRKEYETEGELSPNIYDALYVKEIGMNNWMAIIEIEGFSFDEGYEYSLSVKKITRAEPYSEKYVLLDILSKKVTD